QRAGLLQQLSWPIPDLPASQQLSLWFFLLLWVVIFSVVHGWRAVRAEPGSLRARTILVVSLFSLGIVPQALQRVDSAHFACVSCVPLGFCPVVVFDPARRTTSRISTRHLPLAAGAAVFATVVSVL